MFNLLSANTLDKIFSSFRSIKMPEVNDHAAEPTGANISAKDTDLQTIQESYRLNGKNYLKWSRVVETYLKGKGLLNHLTESPSDRDTWVEEDSLIMTWLWNSMSPEISDTCMFLGTAKEIWDTMRETYSKVNNAAQIYELKTKISSAKQGNKSITEYAIHLQSLWQELDRINPIPMTNVEDAATLKRVFEKDRIFAFLAGLNPEFDAIRVQILGKNELPSLNEVISFVRAEEERRSVMFGTTVEESSREGMDKGSDSATKNPSKNTDKYSLFYNQKIGEKEAAYNSISQTEESKALNSIVDGIDNTNIEKLKKLLETLEAPSKCTHALSRTSFPYNV